MLRRGKIGTASYSYEDGALEVRGGWFSASQWAQAIEDAYCFDIARIRMTDVILEDCSAARLFACFTRLEDADLSGLCVSGVGDMTGMFEDCEFLRHVDLSGWDTSGVTSMGYMFRRCRSLTATSGIGELDVSSVEDMHGTFWDCKSLAYLDLRRWDVGSAGDMATMFQGCSSLAALDLSGWDVSNVADMRGMFRGCSSLASVDLSTWDVSEVERMDGMFAYCAALIGVMFDTKDAMRRIVSVGDMYKDCVSLENLDFPVVETKPYDGFVLSGTGINTREANMVLRSGHPLKVRHKRVAPATVRRGRGW